jgi:hypothetical protein
MKQHWSIRSLFSNQMIFICEYFGLLPLSLRATSNSQPKDFDIFHISRNTTILPPLLRMVVLVLHAMLCVSFRLECVKKSEQPGHSKGDPSTLRTTILSLASGTHFSVTSDNRRLAKSGSTELGDSEVIIPVFKQFECDFTV